MNEDNDLKTLLWISSSKQDLQKFPAAVRGAMGFALFRAQEGKKHRQAKPLKGFGGAGVLEVVEDFDGDAYRAVYTVKFAEVVYMLHAFQKKSKKGVATPAQEINLIKKRLKLAQEDYQNRKDT